MSTIRQRFGLIVSGVLIVAGIWACQATANRDGSVTFTFAPDMAITAWGLEDALSKLTDLLSDCISGTFGRPCTDSERADIARAIIKILDRKDRMRDPSPPDPLG